MHRFNKWTLSLLLGTFVTLQGGTQLSKAAIQGDIEEIKALIEAGEKINDLDKWGWTPLMWAVFYNQQTTTKWLLVRGADPNIKSTRKFRSHPKETTVLGIAATYGNADSIAWLLAAKADPTVVDSEGKAPMDYAKASSCEPCLPLLQGKPQPPSPLHTRANPVIKEKLDDVYILIESGIGKSQKFLNRLKTELEVKLNKRHIRHMICIVDSLSLDGEKEPLSKREAFKPKYIFQWSETSGSVIEEFSRSRSEFRAVMRLEGSPDPVWVKEFKVHDSEGIGPRYAGDVDIKLVRELMVELEWDQLINP